ncbi:hypothetical protein GCK72_009461 [Caenorhabditis remanei]|uniref:Uncharacterized protein n=2 Tax=Caenorhabditis remanei TaxID=31234 RepID=A0A6A5H1T2_CAERE|nr:hypothetical protein GCK72_009461 [Caenorhabditis remanei]KAF1761207.1 hypothetical protein GCK72_009461 [Caenorhabditis remanei]
MVVRHLDDGRFEAVPPLFLKWPAKHISLYTILIDIVISILFILVSNNLSALMLFGVILLSAFFALGYSRESFSIMYIHLVYCIVYIISCVGVVVLIIFDNSGPVHKEMKRIGYPIDPIWVYCFAGVTIISHALMIPPSVKVIKYAAIDDALKKMMEDEEFKKRLRKPCQARPEIPILV